MSDKLKPCPFCGAEDVAEEDVDPFGYSWYRCANCGSNSPNDNESHDGAVERWNTRPIEDAIRTQIEQLQSEKDSLTLAHYNLSNQIADYVAVLELYANKLGWTNRDGSYYGDVWLSNAEGCEPAAAVLAKWHKGQK